MVFNELPARIFELSIGIICSCLPVTPPIFRSLVSLQFANLRPKVSFQNTFHRMKNKNHHHQNRAAENVHLKTSILGSTYGDGRFVRTEDIFPPVIIIEKVATSRIVDVMETNDGDSSRQSQISIDSVGIAKSSPEQQEP